MNGMKHRRVPTSSSLLRKDTATEKCSSGMRNYFSRIAKENDEGRKDTWEMYVASRCITRKLQIRDE